MGLGGGVGVSDLGVYVCGPFWRAFSLISGCEVFKSSQVLQLKMRVLIIKAQLYIYVFFPWLIRFPFSERLVVFFYN